MTEFKTWPKRVQKSVKVCLDRFFFSPTTAEPLAALRMGLSAVLLVQAFLLRHSLPEFFASDGLVQGALARYLSVPYSPRIDWIVTLLSPLRVPEMPIVYFVGIAYVASLVALLLGYHTRFAAVASWLIHWVLMNTAYSTSYGADSYAHVFLFYLMWVPCGWAWSMDVWQERIHPLPSTGARLGLRVLQVHLCVTYLISAIDKAQGPQWWNGELLWRAVNLPVYYQYNMTWLANWPVTSKVLGWMTLVLEGGYFIFIWPKKTRPLWIAGIVGLHLGIVIFLGLGIFGFLMSVLTVAVFAVSPRKVDLPVAALLRFSQ